MAMKFRLRSYRQNMSNTLLLSKPTSQPEAVWSRCKTILSCIYQPGTCQGTGDDIRNFHYSSEAGTSAIIILKPSTVVKADVSLGTSKPQLAEGWSTQSHEVSCVL